MRLRALIQGAAIPAAEPRNPATLAIVATVPPSAGPTVATVATIAALPEPELWPALVRAVAVPGVRWDLAADALASLMAADVLERALILGWHPHELAGVQRVAPHDHPSRAGLIFSMQPGDTVPDVRRSGCAIAIAGTNVRHIWRRSPLDAATCLPWELKESNHG